MTVSCVSRSFWVHPSTDEIFKFLPSNPPQRGDTVLVNGERCKVIRCLLEWDGDEWRMVGRGVKVKRAPLVHTGS